MILGKVDGEMGQAALKWRRKGIMMKERGGQASNVSEKSRKTRLQKIAHCHFSSGKRVEA